MKCAIQVLRSPEASTGGGGTGTAASTVGAAKAQAARTAAPKPAAGKPAATGERMGAAEGQDPPESAADRARARKAASDAANKTAKKQIEEPGARGMKKPEKPAKGAKVQSLAELRKLHSDNVEAKKKGTVEVDDAALPNPKLERGRPEPEVKTRKAPDRPEEDRLAREDEPAVEALAEEQEAIDTNESSAEVTEPLEEGETTEEVTEPFTANTKFSAYGEEHDIPEMFHSLMVDEDSQKQVHDLFTRATAFDRTKQRMQGMEQYFQKEIAPELDAFRFTRDELMGFAQDRDVFSLLKKFGFEERDILLLADERAKILLGSPEEQRRHAELQRTKEEQRASARRVSELEQRSMESAQLAKRTTFESLLARDDVRQMAADIDAKMGSQGYFARAVWNHGKQVYKDSVELARAGRGRVIDLSPEDALKGFMQANGLSFPEAKPGTPVKGAQAPAKGQATGKPVATPAPKPKLIPNLGSKPAATASTQKPVVNSIKDIERIRKEKYGR